MEIKGMTNPIAYVKNTREVWSRSLEKNIMEVQVQFKDENPAWIPYETLLAMESKFRA
jgi:hypothetical protein|tara:strand:- start:405 stop:578 length:174 start_codon:yes stop_codon:yes gene_type:complete